MKITQVIIAAGMFVGSLNAYADNRGLPERAYQASLTTIRLDKQLDSELGGVADVKSGYVVVNTTKNEVTLTLIRQMNCPEGRFCAAVMPTPIIITLPITQKFQGPCNSKVIVATDEVSDPMMPDNVRTITVHDNRKFTCPTFDIVAPTEVELHYNFLQVVPDLGVTPVKTYSRMTGEALTQLQTFSNR